MSTKPKPWHLRQCVVCGAAIRNQNPRCKTCDPICTAARKARRTREEQFERELKNPSDLDHVYCHGCGMILSQCDCWDAVNHVP